MENNGVYRTTKIIFYLLFICFIFQINTGFLSAAQDNTTRTALVIGNADYAISPLQNPVNDAKDIARVLRQSGFDVILEINASLRTMEKSVRSFGKKLRKGGVGLFYYAGHGIQIGGNNFLIPIGSEIESEADVKYGAVDAGLVLGKMEDAGNEMNIVILDACRNNPFARSFRSAQKGLARMDAPKGSLIAYATAPGSVAADGTDGNGIYTKHLIKHIKTPGLTIEQVLKKVRVAVVNETGKKQIPWEASSLMGNFYFQSDPDNRVVSVTPVRPAQQPGKIYQVDDEEEMWLLVKKSENIGDIDAFIAAYPNGRFKMHASIRRNQLLQPKIKPEPIKKKKPDRNAIVPVPYPLRAFEVTSLKFYSAGDSSTDRASRDYKVEFQQENAKLIYSELNIKNFYYEKTMQYHDVEWIYYNPDGSVHGKMTSKFDIKPEWKTAWATKGWGWKTAGKWKEGRYRVVVWMDGIKVTENYFTISPRKKEFRVTSVRFFEAGDTAPKANNKKYKNQFSKWNTKRVWTEVNIENFRFNVREQTHPIEWVYYSPDGSVFGTIKGTFKIKKDWETAWIQRGWGWKTTGKWKKGKYRVRILMDGYQVAEESYHIY